MFITILSLKRSAALALLILTLWLATASAQTHQVLYSFTGGADGANPYGGLVQDAEGNLYGTTYSGGPYDLGTLFKVTSSDQALVLDCFGPGLPCVFPGTDAANPYAGLLLTEDNAYGTTVNGGYSYCMPSGCGTAFSAHFAGKGQSWQYKFTGPPNGANPYGGLVGDANGNVYGTTVNGGFYGYGIVFQINPVGEESVLYQFRGFPDGGHPYDTLVSDTDGNLYGTTYDGGVKNYGTVFMLTVSGKQTTLYSFQGSGAGDGAYPYAGLIRDAQGNLYGTTYAGGSSGNYGTVFKLEGPGKETVLYRFPGGPRGANPYAGLLRDSKGNLYGTTVHGGSAFNAGVVFEITSKNEEKVLYTFCPEKGCADGANPYAGLIPDAKGNLYGTTSAGGNANLGTVFDIAP